jgi:hypothetical protein
MTHQKNLKASKHCNMMRLLTKGFIPSFANRSGNGTGGTSFVTVVTWVVYCEVARNMRTSSVTGIL